jgi:hypothetical protein
LVQSKRHQVERAPGAGAATTSVGEGIEPEQQPREAEDTAWFSGVPLPSEAVLITLLWVIRVEEQKSVRRRRIPNTEAKDLDSLGEFQSWQQSKIVLEVAGKTGPARPSVSGDRVEQSSTPLA